MTLEAIFLENMDIEPNVQYRLLDRPDISLNIIAASIFKINSSLAFK
jgi:hypothetical protein